MTTSTLGSTVPEGLHSTLLTPPGPSSLVYTSQGRRVAAHVTSVVLYRFPRPRTTRSRVLFQRAPKLPTPT